MACVFVYVIVLTFLGPEYLGRDFHVENDADMATAAGAKYHGEYSEKPVLDSGSSNNGQEKISGDHVENFTHPF